jgi:hypothetical protein
MQPHEGPPRDREREERSRQRLLTGKLLAVIGALVAAIVFTLVLRWI